LRDFSVFADRVFSFSESATLALGAKAKQMAASGKDIINFSLGEPDFNTPQSIIEFALNKAKQGATKYTAVAGESTLREAICERIKIDYGMEYQKDEVLVSNGGKQSIFHFLQTVLNPGDQVLIGKPYWTSFPEMVKLLGAEPVFVDHLEGRPDFNDLRAKINSKTRVFILNSPSNPSGVVWRQDELASLKKILEPHFVWLLSDDTYYKLVYPPARFESFLKLFPDFRNRTCLIGSTSKSYAMTGWRLGWAIGPADLIAAMAKIQGQVTSGASSVSQAAAIAALGQGDHVVSEFQEVFSRRRARLLSLLDAAGISYMPPEGAFYCFLRLKPFISSEVSVSQFCEDLLAKRGVCLVPGEAFGEPDFARLSYSLSEKAIEEGVARLLDFFKASKS
jgi:aspartate aminotransferase